MEKPESSNSDKSGAAGIDTSSDQITLRPLELSDADEFVKWYMDDRVAEFIFDSAFSSVDEVMKYINCCIIPHPWQRAVCLNGKPVGSLTVSPATGDDSYKAEIGYLFSSEYWGRGIATQAVKMASKAVFEDWPHLRRIEGIVLVEHVASQRVLQKAGFTKEEVLKEFCMVKGVLRDFIMFSLHRNV